jgi:hypothetical protein
MQGVTGTVQFAQFPGMVGTIYFNPADLRRMMGDGPTGPTVVTRQCLGPTGPTVVTRQCLGPTGPTVVTRECWGSTGSTGNRYVNVNYTVNANTSGKVTSEITF